MSGKSLGTIPQRPAKRKPSAQYVSCSQANDEIRTLVRELDEELDGVRIPASAAAIVNRLRTLVAPE